MDANTELHDREKVLAIASEMFFYQGFRNTSMEEVLQRAGIGRARFEKLFETKEKLLREYLRRRNDHDADMIWGCVSKCQGPRERFLGLIECIAPWLGDHKFRGCAFLNIVAELPAHSPLVGSEGVAHYERLRSLAQHLAEELKRSDPIAFDHLDPALVADEYMVIITGAISLATLYQNNAAAAPALRAVEQLLRKRD